MTPRDGDELAAGRDPAGESNMAAKQTAPAGGEHEAPASGDRGPDPIDVLVDDIKAELARLADPDVIARAAALSELDGARLVQRIRKEASVAAVDARKFSSKVGAARKDSERAAAVSRRMAAAEKRVPTWRDALDRDKEDGRVRPTFANLCTILENAYGDRLAFDIMAERPLLDGAALTDRIVSKVRRAIGEEEGVNFGDEDIGKGVAVVGGEIAEVHPVRDYLQACRASWDGKPRLDRAAGALLNVKDRLSGVMVKRTIIAMAARGMYPGIKVDTILILCGYQGQKKSTFFRVLGGLWFGDSRVDITDRKGQMVMASKWLYEWPECDRMFTKHSDSDIKAFTSQQDDTFVPMFGRAVATVLRSWISVGTTNRQKFLTDVTGDRRSWVVDMHPNGKRWKVSARKVEAVRDQLFGEAVAEVEAFYDVQAQGVADDDNPHRWWLNDAEEAEREDRTKAFRVENAWTDTVGRWLMGEPVKCPTCKGTGEGFGRESDGSARPCSTCGGASHVRRGALPTTPEGREYVTPAMVLSEALNVPPERHQAHGTKIAEVLAELGWEVGNRIRVPPGSARQVTPYYSPEPNPEAAEREATAGVTSPMGERAPGADVLPGEPPHPLPPGTLPTP